MYSLLVEVVGKGFATGSSKNFEVEHQLQLTSISPSEGSVAGGMTVVLEGTGFSLDKTLNRLVC